MNELVPYESVGGEDLYRVRWLSGVTKIKPIEHFLTWLDHDSFEVRSEYMTMTGCRAEDLSMVLAHMWPVTVVNERPPAPTVWQRLRAALTPPPSTPDT